MAISVHLYDHSYCQQYYVETTLLMIIFLLGVQEAVKENVKEATETVGKKMDQAKRSAQGKISFGMIVYIIHEIKSDC